MIELTIFIGSHQLILPEVGWCDNVFDFGLGLSLYVFGWGFKVFLGTGGSW